jgi:hypothetical protein
MSLDRKRIKANKFTRFTSQRLFKKAKLNEYFVKEPNIAKLIVNSVER